MPRPYMRHIAATDREIDRLVYELYGLTEEEIKIVEGESATRERKRLTSGPAPCAWLVRAIEPLWAWCRWEVAMKVWEKPKLVILVRSQPQEQILGICKRMSDPAGGGPDSQDYGCVAELFCTSWCSQTDNS